MIFINHTSFRKINVIHVVTQIHLLLDHGKVPFGELEVYLFWQAWGFGDSSAEAPGQHLRPNECCRTSIHDVLLSIYIFVNLSCFRQGKPFLSGWSHSRLCYHKWNLWIMESQTWLAGWTRGRSSSLVIKWMEISTSSKTGSRNIRYEKILSCVRNLWI